MVPFQIVSEREFVGPPLGTNRQGTMSMTFNVWISGELIYVGAGEMPRRSANKSGSIHGIRVLVTEANEPGLCAPSLPYLLQQDTLSWLQDREERRKARKQR